MNAAATASAEARRIVNVMTVDVEDYFHVSGFADVVPRDRWDTFESRVCEMTDRLLTMFDESGVRATFFVLGWVGKRFPELIRRIAAAGHEIASHGYGHRLLYELNADELREDLRRARDVLESATGVAVRGFRAPSYSITARSLWALDVLIEEGYRYDSSIFPIHHDRYGMPLAPRHAYLIRRAAGTLWEIPPATLRWGAVNIPIGGGGYFRLLPYAVTRWAIQRINGCERKPAVLYVHPWEIDTEQPRLPGSSLSRFRHYCNLHKTEARLRRLVAEFQFGPITELLARESRPRGASDASAAPATGHAWEPERAPGGAAHDPEATWPALLS